ncbi:MAG: NAD(P)H-hydrate dehydratase [Bacteroidaceae bacterium]|nr:NAD(P)H-hydrate dehydratase [Bacteroidaceae bacterium]
MDKYLIEGCINELVSVYGSHNVTAVTKDTVKPMLKGRTPQAHKGDFGHALLYAGSLGMAGAAVLSARACLRSGVGLLTVCSPSCNNDILQISVPEAMTIPSDDLYANTDLSRYNAVGAGPGLGKGESQTAILEKLLKSASYPMVLDADALNIISMSRYLLEYVPAGSVITPHPGELKRLTGEFSDGKDMMAKAAKLAKENNITVVVKGAPTVTITPEGKFCVNTTGNPGMATGGSGDVLTGMVLALLAQGYTPDQAAVIAVFIHGFAGDMAAHDLSMTAMTSADIADHLPKAWLQMTETL